jgi:hypothetical protein
MSSAEVEAILGPAGDFRIRPVSFSDGMVLEYQPGVMDAINQFLHQVFWVGDTSFFVLELTEANPPDYITGGGVWTRPARLVTLDAGGGCSGGRERP